MSDPFTTSNPATGNQINPNATVTIAQVLPDDSEGHYVPPTNLAGEADTKSIFVDYMSVNRYVNSQRRYMASVTSPAGFNGQSAAFFQLGAPTLLWICEWTAAKYNGKPTIPDPEPADDDWVLLSKHLTASQVSVNPADGVTPRYRISGVYVYGKKTPSADVIDDIDFPRPPWLDDFFSRKTTDEMYAGNLIDALE